MSETDERIKKAADELGRALSDGGGSNYWVNAHAIDVTRMDSDRQQFLWTVEVEETSVRKIAP